MRRRGPAPVVLLWLSLSVVVCVALAGALWAAASPPGGALLVTVGEVTERDAMLWVRDRRGGEVAVEFGPASGGTSPERRRLLTHASADRSGRLRLQPLAAGTRYRYRVGDDAEAVTGEFVTAPAATEAARVHLVWGGDLGGGGFCRPLEGGYPVFRAMARLRPDFFLFVGDTVYADQRCGRPGTVPATEGPATTLVEYHGKHRYNREDAAVQALFRQTSVYAIWDDHEVRNDFDRTHPLMPVGRRAFLDYWPITPPAEEPGRLYRSSRWGRLLEVFILDTRQYRTPNVAPDGPAKTMLGAVQRRWLLEAVGASDAVWKLVVSTVSLSIPTGKPERRDSWSNANVWGTPQEGGTGFATERDAILRAFHARGVRNLVFVVADVHHAEAIRHRPAPDHTVHEFVAGPLSASLGRPRPLDDGLGPHSLFARGGLNTFGEIVVEPDRLTLRLREEDGTVMFAHTIAPE